MNAGRAEAAFWAAFLRNRNVDAGTAGDGAVAVAGGFALCVLGTALDLAVGAGTLRPLRLDDCEVVESFYQVRALPARFELDEDVLRRDAPLLRERGYADDGTELAVLEAPVARDAARDAARGRLAVRTTTDRRAWVDLVTRAAAESEPVLPVSLRTAQIDAAAAQVLVVATIDGEDAAGGALGIVGDTAMLYASSVLPAFRRNGLYGALIAARLGIAHERGTDRAIVKVTPDGAAERCALRQGFARTALRRRFGR